jgi:hypothetical protein
MRNLLGRFDDVARSPMTRRALVLAPSMTCSGVAAVAQGNWTSEQHQVLAAIERLSASTALGGAGPDAFAAVLADGFSRWTSAVDRVPAPHCLQCFRSSSTLIGRCSATRSIGGDLHPAPDRCPPRVRSGPGARRFLARRASQCYR